MTDEELIARLRKFGELWPDDYAAADRIEALVKKLDIAMETMHFYAAFTRVDSQDFGAAARKAIAEVEKYDR